jgi:hypothetical protein
VPAPIPGHPDFSEVLCSRKANSSGASRRADACGSISPSKSLDSNVRIDDDIRMKMKKSGFLFVVACMCLVGLHAAAGVPQAPPELIGTWDYTSMTALKNGKPFGTVHFQPGQWTVTFNRNATWTMKLPSIARPGELNGNYEVRGRDVQMILADGKPYQKYRFAVEQDGKVLTLTGKEDVIRANLE